MSRVLTLWTLLAVVPPLLGAGDRYLPFDHPDVHRFSAPVRASEPPPDTLGTAAGWAFRLFQVFLSSQDGPNCRYHPTCSHYALLAFRRYGPVLGFLMAGDRLLRCNPFGGYGYDPPEDHLVTGRRR